MAARFLLVSRITLENMQNDCQNNGVNMATKASLYFFFNPSKVKGLISSSNSSRKLTMFGF